MRKFLSFIIVTLFAVSTPFYAIKSGNVCADGNTRRNPNTVYHLFTHALIAYPEIAFADDNPMREHYKKDCLTVEIFKNALTQLQKNNFVLVSPEDVFVTDENGTTRISVPKIPGKKPLLMSFDDINYYSNKANLGMNDKLIVDKDGKLASFTRNTEKQINYDNECITVLENFIKNHPNFSRNNAKGTICLTGFDGILGYRTQRDGANRAAEISRVKTVIAKLKSLNWKFACHSYGHYHMKKLSDERFRSDTDKWLREVAPLIGGTQIYVYPYGEYDFSGDALGNKHDYLVEKGFKIFWGVGGVPFLGKMPYFKDISDKIVFMDRTPLDGQSLNSDFLRDYYGLNFRFLSNPRVFQQ